MDNIRFFWTFFNIKDSIKNLVLIENLVANIIANNVKFLYATETIKIMYVYNISFIRNMLRI